MFCEVRQPLFLLAACVLGHGFRSLADSVFGELTRQEQTDSGLDFSGRDGRLLVVVGQTRGFAGDSLEDVVDEGVHDAHGFAGDSSIGMDLLQDLVDVDGIAFFTLGPSLLVATNSGLLASFLSTFGRNTSRWFHRHFRFKAFLSS